MNTNENLPLRRSKRHPDPLRTGAASFKRVLGGQRVGTLEASKTSRCTPSHELPEVVGQMTAHQVLNKIPGRREVWAGWRKWIGHRKRRRIGLRNCSAEVRVHASEGITESHHRWVGIGIH